jgi:hypothetical protein
MGFLSSKSAVKTEPAIKDMSPETPSARPDDVYADLIARRPGLLDEKLKLHERIIDEFNLTALEKLPDELAKQVRTYVGDHVRRESLSLNQKELDIFSNEIIAEMTGYGPLEPLLKDPTVTDILINTHRRCYIERFGQLQERPRSISRMKRISCASSTGSSRRSDGASTNRRPWWMRGYAMARASTSRSGRSPSMDRWSRFENLPSAFSIWTGSLK